MTSLTTLKIISSANGTEVIAAAATSRSLGTNAYMNTHTRTCTFTHDAGRQVAPLVLLSIHPSYHRTDHMCTPTHARIDTDREDRGGSDAGKWNEENRLVAPLVLLSIRPSCHRTKHMCTRTHAQGRRYRVFWE